MFEELDLLTCTEVIASAGPLLSVAWAGPGSQSPTAQGDGGSCIKWR
jgi:hypothetical protein